MKKKEKNKILNRLLKNRIIKWVIFPLGLLTLWLILSLLYSSYQSFTVLQYAHNLDKGDNFNGRKLLKDQKISGVFTAHENNLGIISVRFGEVPRPDYDLEDVLVFKIKKIGDKNWTSTNKYRSGSITQDLYYPFGFKQIEDSKGKSYLFEIDSTRGNYLNAIEISRENPIYISKYKFSKNDIFHNPTSLFSFSSKKTITFLTNSESLISSTVFILPFIFYLLWIIFPIDRLIKSDGKITGGKLFQAFVAILIFFDISFYEFINYGFMAALIGLWLISIYINRSKSFVSFTLAFILTIFSIIAIYFNLNISVDKSSSFAYFFLFIGFFQSVVEFRSSVKK